MSNRRARVRLGMPRPSLPRLFFALFATLGMGAETVAKVAHGVAHQDEARRARAHTSPHTGVASPSGETPHHQPGIESNASDADHGSLHATAAAPQLTLASFPVPDVVRVPAAPLLVVVDRSLAHDQLARPPSGVSPPSRPRAPPLA